MQPKTPAANVPKEVGKPIAPPTQVTRVRYSPDGKTLAAACFDGKVRAWDVGGKEPAELTAFGNHNGWVTDLLFMALPPKIGDKLYTADSWGRLSAWDIDGKPRWTVDSAHDGWLRAVAHTPDKAVVITCGKDGYVRQWAAASGKRDIEWKVGADLLSLAVAPAGASHFYVGDLFGLILEFNYATGKPGRTFDAKDLYKYDRIQDVGGVKCLALSGDGKTLFAAGGVPKNGGTVQGLPSVIAFDVASGKRLSQYRGETDTEAAVTDLAWHKGGFVIFTTSGVPGTGKFYFWKPGDAKASFVGGKLPNCHGVAIHPDGETFAISATNANSNGNGRVKGKAGEYPQNSSPIQLWKI